MGQDKQSWYSHSSHWVLQKARLASTAAAAAQNIQISSVLSTIKSDCNSLRQILFSGAALFAYFRLISLENPTVLNHAPAPAVISVTERNTAKANP